MQLLLLTNVPGLDIKHSLVEVADSEAALRHLDNRVALVATPMVRQRYSEEIKRRYSPA